MVATTKSSGADRISRGFWSDWFRPIMLTLSALVLLCGAGGFFYLGANSPLSLLGGSDRPIAAATLFVPSQSPFSFSLLTRPEQLVAFAQSLEDPAQRSQTLQDAAQIEQRLLEKIGLDTVGLDYEQAIQPWLGEEATFAVVSADIDANVSNGEQPGYLVALEIGLNHQREAKEFLQLFWQQQALAGNALMSESVSGVRILSTPSDDLARSPTIKATALVGAQFVLLANDARVLRRSLQVAQTAENLAQSPAYRQAAEELPERRIGLAYCDLTYLDPVLSSAAEAKGPLDSPFIAMSVGLERTGLVVTVAPDQNERPPSIIGRLARAGKSVSLGALQFLPADSEVAIASQDLSQLKSFTEVISTDTSFADTLPDLFKSVLLSSASSPLQADAGSGPDGDSDGDPSDLWNWATGDYALARVGSDRSQNWLLAVERDPAGIAALDQQAIASGYSKSTINIEAADVTIWSRLVARPNDSQNASQFASKIETELLGLHVQQGRHEIFTNSLATMITALSVLKTSPNQSLSSQNLPSQDQLAQGLPAQNLPAAISLIQSAKFKRAVEPLGDPDQGYLYLDWPAVAPALSRRFPVIDQISSAIAPLSAHIDTVAATRQAKLTSFFFHIHQ